jgi:hypothetical protein
MRRGGRFDLSMLLVLAGVACSNAGSSGGSNGTAGAPGANGGDAGDGPEPGGMAGGATLPVPGNPEAGAPDAMGGGAPVDPDPELSLAGAPAGGATGETGATDPTQPDLPFDLGSAATSLGEPLETTQQALDPHTTEYTLLGATSNTVLDESVWSTGPEAEFECQRGSLDGSIVVGSDRMLFLGVDAMWLSLDTACIRISVTQNAVYSATLTRAFARDVFGAP